MMNAGKNKKHGKNKKKDAFYYNQPIGLMKEIINNRKLQKKTSNNNQAISGMIVTILLIRIIVSIGGVLSVTLTDVVSTRLVLDTM